VEIDPKWYVHVPTKQTDVSLGMDIKEKFNKFISGKTI